MKLYDVLPDSGVFTAMNNIKPFPWADVYTPQQMDTAFKQGYTNKEVSRLVSRYLGEDAVLTPEKVNILADILYTLFYDKWVNTYNAFMESETSLGRGYTETIEEVIDHDNQTTDTGTTENTGTQVGQISAYNSTEFQDKDQTTNTGTNTRNLAGTDKGKQTRSYTRTGHGENYVDYYKKSLEVLQTYILCDIIFVDTSGTLAVHIYD